MKNLLKKVRGDKKGFTLAELLVVVAIIGILVAISIPIFTAQLGKARKATNQANLRAAKAAAVAAYLSEDQRSTDGSKTDDVYRYTYNIKDGTVTSATSDLAEAATIDSAADSYVYSSIVVAIGNQTVDSKTEMTVTFTVNAK